MIILPLNHISNLSIKGSIEVLSDTKCLDVNDRSISLIDVFTSHTRVIFQGIYVCVLPCVDYSLGTLGLCVFRVNKEGINICEYIKVGNILDSLTSFLLINGFYSNEYWCSSEWNDLVLYHINALLAYIKDPFINVKVILEPSIINALLIRTKSEDWIVNYEHDDIAIFVLRTYTKGDITCIDKMCLGTGGQYKGKLMSFEELIPLLEEFNERRRDWYIDMWNNLGVLLKSLKDD